ncbi:hypothetical protein [Streptomyces sp. NBC_01643]|uniref:hypothetical protein n=1 Tax=Streptomyces sp. NBC_01643 TaxID=2975906 RepID=UPI00386C958D|nr:hypothetical protein OHB03_20790 [Streptomyces sp. NBC_01643]
MRRQTWGSTGRRGTVFAASAAVLCLGGALAACGAGTGGGDGYVAVGAAGTGPEKAPTGAVAPSGKVTLIPLDGARSDGGGGDAGEGAEPKPGSSAQSGAPGGAGGTGDGAGGGTQSPGSSGAVTGGTTGSASSSSSGDTGGTGSADGSGGSGSVSPGPSTPSAPGSTAPAGPAVLTLSAPERAAADDRWCEKVTVEFRNTGGSPVRSGTVTFATHIIGALGIDWATIESTAPLPAPIDAGAARKKTYTVCVDAWRVPLGMHIETRDVTAVWK